MTAVQHAFRKGWCPGVRRPMLTGDGQIVRIRPRCGRLWASDLAAVAELARDCGSGLIDLTRRANIQIRGLRPGSLSVLWPALDALGLADATADAEAARNVVVGPLAGLDPAEAMDVRPLASALEDALLREAADLRLPGKFGFIVDGGGHLSLDDERADILLRAVRSAKGAEIAIGIDCRDGVRWLLLAAPGDAVAAAMRVVHAFSRLPRRDGARMSALSDTEIEALEQALDGFGRAASDFQCARAASKRPLGIVSFDGCPVAVGLAPPFGRVEAADLLAIARRAIDLGLTELRVSPWRSFYVPVPDAKIAGEMLAVAEAHGMITTSGDPLLAIDACPGAPACASAELDTRAAARALAPLLAGLGCKTAHVSGCHKGCARSKAADLVLVGDGGRFRVVRHGTVRDLAIGFVTPDAISSLPSLSRLL